MWPHHERELLPLLRMAEARFRSLGAEPISLFYDILCPF
jgi:hypothetical protein